MEKNYFLFIMQNYQFKSTQLKHFPHSQFENGTPGFKSTVLSSASAAKRQYCNSLRPRWPAAFYLGDLQVEIVQQQTSCSTSCRDVGPLPGKHPVAQQDGRLTVFRGHWETHAHGRIKASHKRRGNTGLKLEGAAYRGSSRPSGPGWSV